MTTETKIAEEKVKKYLKCREDYKFSIDKSELSKDICTNNYNKIIGRCEEHKASCQRFLEFFGSLHFGGYVPSRKRKITQKEDDLKQAIKIYDDAGI